LLFVSVAFACAYYFKLWRPSASKLPQPPRAA
jgi:hypothetical protein